MLQRLQFQELLKDKTVDQNPSPSIEQFQEIFKSLDLGKTNHCQKYEDELSEFIADFNSWVERIQAEKVINLISGQIS